ncbi:hypothetical protein DAPPUDRAFT_268432 [Daphnia pulex]|uniref:Uncharacterized protein n=1 Tax=Daphnia pulex TaxID=6669 RepID=E9HXU0_DAPPU|nr:hypothetical protein DAPPUDRAFT_268432 [Daphnia pulex]|eukprot:EFX63440.1 hypothetical protein DAPPUDRAFT_268432 [Daphnia pulex]
MELSYAECLDSSVRSFYLSNPGAANVIYRPGDNVKVALSKQPGSTVGNLGSPFSPCYWTKGFVNFNNKPFGYRDNTWVPIEAKIVLPLQTLAHSFRYDEVKYFDYAHQSNPAYSDTIIDHMNIMADIAAAMNEHSAGNYSPAHIPSTATVLGTVADAAAKTSWLDQLTNFLYIGAVIIIAVVSIRVCIACGCCGLIWKFCSLLRIPTRAASNRENDIELGITGLNPEYIQQLWVAPSVIYSLVLFVRPALREMERSLQI